MTWSLEILSEKKIDVYYLCSKNAVISIPAELWFQCICSSLRKKHSVLIILKDIELFPVWDPAKRWDVCDNWCWLSARSLSVISATHKETPFTLESFLSFLRSSK